jgi:LDH2 family malate/lactate/ureidoglycolate dehydrogenase
MTNHLITLPLDEVRHLGCQVLKKNGTAPKIAGQVIDDLINNEIEGYGSHGLLRLIEYVELLRSQHIIPRNRPRVRKKGQFASEVDGQKCFGVLSVQAVSKTLIKHLTSHHFGMVTLINSGHISRLASIALPVCQQGGAIIGFSNLSGAGQNVLVYGGNKGRLCTNPIVIGVPSKQPIIVDMSTSAVSEGKLRKSWLKGEKVPKGWLFDKHGKSVCDPNKFYQNPQLAFLGPLGGKELGYKGFALALMTEIFAGILTGGGFSQDSTTKINNNGLFLAFNPTFVGQSLEQFQQQVATLINYLKSSCTDGNLHIPGQNMTIQKRFDEKQPLSINIEIFEKLQVLANS